jgi:iron complex outermembrane receptor protein
MCALSLGSPNEAMADARSASNPALAEMSLEDLFNLEVTSVSKKAQPLSRAAAAIFVLTNEDIRRSGVLSIPEALRMVPGIQVERATGNTWAISSRGFDSVYSDKLLVLIDGRTVYTPLFGGVYWDVQDTLLEDIDRIEVIRGPGGTLWGANAVNGVINIVTKAAEDTQGLFAEAGMGNIEKGFGGARAGGKYGEDIHFRVYGKGFKRDQHKDRDVFEAHDGSNQVRTGTRLDWEVGGRDLVTVQGDMYRGQSESNVPVLTPPNFAEGDSDLFGANVLARWTHHIGEGSDLNLQFYFDRTEREGLFISEDRDTWDVDFQHRFEIMDWSEVVWGLGYRRMADDVNDDNQGVTGVGLSDESRRDNLWSGFIQIETLLLDDRLSLILGTKLEHNAFTDWEWQPNVRASFMPTNRHTVWSAISRAVRTPSRANNSAEVLAPANCPPPLDLAGRPCLTSIDGSVDGNFQSEVLWAFELGYRGQFLESVSVDVTGFYNMYEELTSIEAYGVDVSTTPILLLTNFTNSSHGDTWGVELWARWQVFTVWRLDAGLTVIRQNFEPDSCHDTARSFAFEGSSPDLQFNLRSILDLPWNFQLDGALFYVDSIERDEQSFYSTGVPSYVRVDLRLGWQPTSSWDLSAVVQNTFNDGHDEADFGEGTIPSRVPRSIYGKATWRY